jgi:hypothetical protein
VDTFGCQLAYRPHHRNVDDGSNFVVEAINSSAPNSKIPLCILVEGVRDFIE